MKTALLITGVLTGLLLASTMICGFWIKANKATIPDLASAISFHIKIGTFP